MSWILFILHAAWTWLVGLFSFGIVATALGLVVFALIHIADLRRESREKRRREHRATNCRESVIRTVPRGYTLTVLDRAGADLASAPVLDPGAPVYLTVRRGGMASRYALLRAGRVVREGDIVPRDARGPRPPDSLVFDDVVLDAGAEIRLHLPLSWFPAEVS